MKFIPKVICCSFLSLLLANQLYASIGDTVKIEHGTIQGVVSDDGSLSIFKGIPFAAPPINELRWKIPQVPTSWDAIKSTKQFSAGCMQTVVKGDKLPWSNEFLHQGPISEDCLYLNVWSPANDSQKDKLPVIIWIHGGGFIEGSANVPLYDGYNIAKKGIVFVTFNYRLGVFGFFQHPELTNEAGSSGNYGLYDQLAAIKWVNKNIANFGGDPNNITIMGQSAGANSIVLLIASPLSAGLFQKAIIESGPGTTISDYGVRPLDMVAQPLVEAEKIIVEWSNNNQYHSLKALRSAPALELLKKFNQRPPFKGAVIEGVLLPDSIAMIYAQGLQNEIPVISGMNNDERGSEKDYGKMTKDQLTSYAQRYYPFNTQQFLSIYQANNDKHAGELHKQIMRDERIFSLQWLANTRMSKGIAKNYVYYFEKAIPWQTHPQYGVFHSSEFVYVLQNQDKLFRHWDEQDKKISSTIGDYWINFAKTGDPNGDGFALWPSFDQSNNQVMVFGNTIEMKEILPNSKALVISEKIK
ncbi:carboxylesterase type B [Orbus hercynius]|uniref:Carboxylic ester hydrolase n=1 Tax=Orbus hercynius TaxID=593135 RepID=A0A495RKV9_9GAMM|nr:carboxylesterase family protein [Orbus hercynius]RKS87418.1 carboxylesterase type B [Orbus hercynius]